jgi:hypothetical protein
LFLPFDNNGLVGFVGLGCPPESTLSVLDTLIASHVLTALVFNVFHFLVVLAARDDLDRSVPLLQWLDADLALVVPANALPIQRRPC